MPSTCAPIEPTTRTFLADAIEGYLAGEDDQLDRALGLRGSPGQRKARTIAILAERDRMLAEAAAKHFPGDVPTEQARRLYRAWTRYASSAWPRERVLCAPPDNRAGTIEGQLWRVMKLRDHVLSEPAIRSALAASSMYSLPDA